MTNIDKNTFSETINISSNIKDNKNTIIGKFDLKDILFILFAGIVGIGVLSILLVALSIRNMFLILIVLALFEVPIVTLGFLKLHNIPMLDYIKMKGKSDNKSYRKQILKKKKSKADKYIVTICIDNEGARTGELCDLKFNILERVMNDLYVIMPYKKAELKIIFNTMYLTLEVQDFSMVIYDKIFDYLRLNKDIKYISNEDLKNFEIYINSLKFADKKYGKKQIKLISEFKTKLSKLKMVEEVKDRYEYLTNRIISVKNNTHLKVYKFLLYKSPFDINVFTELMKFCNITSHISINTQDVNNDRRKIFINNLNYIDTFIDIACKGELCEPENNISELEMEVKKVLDKHNIICKEINEEKVKDSLLLLTENKY